MKFLERNYFEWLTKSPSTRRVWIEIYIGAAGSSRDGSPSTRRVWIEILKTRLVSWVLAVTLHAEGVD